MLMLVVATLIGLLAGVINRSAFGESTAANPAILEVVTIDGNNRSTSSGTGWFLEANGVAVTSSTTVNRAVSAGDRLLTIIGNEFYAADLVCSTRVVDTQGTVTPRADIAEIKLRPSDFPFQRLSGTTGTYTAHTGPLPAFQTLSMAQGSIDVGQPVMMVNSGTSLGSQVQVPGVVNSLGTAFDGTRLFGIRFSGDAPNSGASGAPVLNNSGQVAGVFAWEDPKTHLGYAQTVDVLKRCSGP